MSTDTVKPVAWWLLIGGLVASVALAAAIERDKRRLAGTVEQLHKDLADAQQTIAAQTDQVSSLEADLSSLQGQLAQSEQDVSRLQAEQLGFRAANAQLSQHLTELARDNEAMRMKLSSIKELKATIRLVQAQLRQERWQQWLARVDAQRADDRMRLSQGNRGYLVRGGVSTIASGHAASATARLQVRVLEPQLE